jgi:hypothetical protein
MLAIPPARRSSISAAGLTEAPPAPC